MNRNNHFVACGDSIEEAEQFDVRFGLKKQGDTTIIDGISQNLEAFINRYALLIPPNVNLSRITQLQHELGAINPLLTKNVADVIYLTADKFLNIHFLVEKAKKNIPKNNS